MSPLTVLSRLRAGRSSRAANVGIAVAVLTVVLTTSMAVSLIGVATDRTAMTTLLRGARGAPLEVLAAAGFFLGAFGLRARLWTRMAPGLTFGQALSGILVATGANHVLPFRLGEPLRAVSVVKRAGMAPADAISSTVALRVGDVLALLAIGLVLGPRVVLDTLGWWGLPVVALIVSAGVWAIRRVSRSVSSGRLRPPDAVIVAGTLTAWLMEAVLMWRVAHWAGIPLSYLHAVLVTAVAVATPLVALTPGGVGTYEAAATAALVAVGVEPGRALAVALGAHATKTVLTVGAGLVAAIVPGPPLYGRLRLPRQAAARPPSEHPVGPGDIVLFLPAHDEAPRIGAVISRAPATIAGRRVRVIVVDDGSTDGTAAEAAAAGAAVVSHDENRGLGAAVATGFRVASEQGVAVVAFCDADGEYDPAELEHLVTPILAGEADYVVGSRFDGTIEHMHRRRRFGNQVLTRWVAWTARLPISDGQSGYRALSAPAAREAVIAHDYNYAQVLTLDLLRRGFRYHEVPITYRFRRSGQSFVRLPRYLRRCVPAVWRAVNAPIGYPCSEADAQAESAEASAGCRTPPTAPIGSAGRQATSR